MIYLRFAAVLVFGIVVAIARAPSRSFIASGSLWCVVILVASTVALALWHRFDRTSSDPAKSKKLAFLYVFLSAVTTYNMGVLYTVVAGSRVSEPVIVISTHSLRQCHLVRAVTASKKRVDFCGSRLWRVNSGGTISYKRTMWGVYGRS